ncbi:AAA family ATPase [Persicimonas caeni]|uniref:AAA family ATPase n=1 Tax=Persicimonas caeni TaxID=2292766 RepID=A0A4Y6PPM5_PERCE|nr:AAA family ATPase [Persicimonas caeni]QDG50049.1 AAA family ATPase [Persicimonas caeni]QED31270.1 AAA family ATPase [Persicimonas caeni]
MNLNLHIYVAQPQKGHFRASVPFIEPLAQPVEGTSPAQLKEELMFRALELVHGQMNPAQLDSLVPPETAQLVNVWLEIERKVDPNKPPVSMNAWTHVIAGRFEEGGNVHVWVPSVPGACFVIAGMEEVYEGARSWAEQWADDNNLSDLDVLASDYPARLEKLEVDLGFPAADPHDDDAEIPGGRLRRPESLVQVATNLTHRAEDGNLRRAYGRQKLVDELVEMMTASTPAHVCLVGPAGSGKTAIIEEAARQTFELQQTYQQRRDVWQTSGDRIIAGMSIIGQWEQRAEAICEELADRGDVLVVDDFLGLVRAGKTYEGDSNVARFIEPYLDGGRFSLIAEATEATFEVARMEAPGFVERFRRIQVPELDHEETLSVVTELVRALEAQQRVRFTPDAVEAMLRLSGRYLRQEAFPGKAVRLVRQCFTAAVRQLTEEMEVEARIDPDLVAKVVHRQTGLPLRLLVPGRGRAPEDVESTFESRVFDQPEATDVVTSLIVATEQGMTDPQRPLGSFLLIGPSGVGKTETAKALAVDLFGGRDRLVRFDMSEFSEPGAATRLIGTAREPDGELTGRVRIQPFCVLLFDEIEKAHPMVLDLLLQLLGDGRLTDAAGRTVDFCNTVVLMTSNLGAGSEERWMGFTEKNERDRQLHYRRAAEEFFRPELFNRIDRVVPYRPLSSETLRRIARRTLRELLERRGLRQGQIMVDVDRRLVEHLVSGVVDRRYGARTLAHRIEQKLITPLARKLADHDPDRGLTRAVLAPSEDEGMELRLRTLVRATRAKTRPPGVRLFVDGVDGDSLEGSAERLRTRLEFLADELERCEASAARHRIDETYEASLEELNTRASSGSTISNELAERVRQREIFRGQLRELRKSLESLLDPEQTGEFELPDIEHFDKSKLHRWSERADEIFGQLTWVKCQIHALSERDADAATLVVEGLSGQYPKLLAHWRRWLEDFAEAFDVNLAQAGWSSEGWRELERGDDLTGMSSVAVSAEHPGISAAFEALAGYLWAPQPPSHGHHALVLLTARADGSSDARALIDELDARDIGATDTGSDGTNSDETGTDSTEQAGELRIEYVLRDGKLTQPRLGQPLTVPDTRGNAAPFAAKLIFGRLALEPDKLDIGPAREPAPNKGATTTEVP